MSENSGESKTKNATDFRLKKQRELGQIAKSRILITLVTYIIGVGLGVLFFGILLNSFVEAINVTSHYIVETNSNYNFDFSYKLISEIIIIIFTFKIILVIFGLVAHAIYSNGLIIAPNLLSPEFSKLSPVRNLKNIFEFNQIIEKLINITKCLIWIFYSYSVLYILHIDLISSLNCNILCVWSIFSEIFIFLVGGSIVFALVSLLFEIPFQKYVFIKRQKTTLSQFKRDRKETSGAPEIKRELRRKLRQLYQDENQTLSRQNSKDSAEKPISSTNKTRDKKHKSAFNNVITKHKKLCKDSYLITGTRSAVGIRFSMSDQYPVPIIVAAAPISGSSKMLSDATRLGIPVLNEPNFADSLGHKHTIGSILPEEFFVELGDVLKRSGLFR